MSIYPSIYLSIYIYIYLLQSLCVLFIATLSQRTHTQWSHWFYIQITFSSLLYLIIATSRNSLPRHVAQGGRGVGEYSPPSRLK